MGWLEREHVADGTEYGEVQGVEKTTVSDLLDIQEDCLKIHSIRTGFLNSNCISERMDAHTVHDALHDSRNRHRIPMIRLAPNLFFKMLVYIYMLTKCLFTYQLEVLPFLMDVTSESFAYYDRYNICDHEE